MTKSRGSAFLLVLVLGLTGCGGDSPTSTNEAAEAEAEGEDAGSNDDQENKDAGSDDNADDAKDPGKTGSAGGGDNKQDDATAEGSDDDASSAWYPQPGMYTYSQSGFEEFCDASRCDKQDLPPTQDVKTTHKSQSSNEVVVVTEAEASNSRFVRTTTRHTPDGAFVTDVYLKFDYEGVSFNNSYQPEPPVEVLRLPLRSGMKWAGRWEDKTSGDYEIEVGPKETVSVGGRSVQAFRLSTITHFRGEFDGSAVVTIWIDPATLAPVKTKGKLDVKSFFGTYRSEFTATLRSAPGYR